MSERPADGVNEPEELRAQQAAQALAQDARNAPLARRGAERTLITSAITTDATDAGFSGGQRSREVTDDELSEEDTLPLVILGLRVLDVVARGDGTVPMGQRALQLLESGDTLELVHLPEGIDPSMLTAVDEGRNELVHHHEGDAGWLVLRAPVSLEELEELLQRLEAGR